MTSVLLFPARQIADQEFWSASGIYVSVVEKRWESRTISYLPKSIIRLKKAGLLACASFYSKNLPIWVKWTVIGVRLHPQIVVCILFH